MRAYDLLEKKKNGQELNSAQIRYMIEGFMNGEIPDYQMSAFLMAICINGMSEQETLDMTELMRSSGEEIDLSGIDAVTVDKHSTGGVGDKTTLILAPALAALGGRVAKMSGRGLGHTGGTVDKLESIPGFRTELSPEEFTAQVNRIGLCVVSQSAQLAPADKKIYALRDLTATVESIPLIASSIMSKKLAAGSKAIVLDVTCGSGAFMKEPEKARELAGLMIRIGERSGRRMAALITDMNQPLGHEVGNLCEVKEALEVLSGNGPQDLIEVCSRLGAAMWSLCCGRELEECRKDFIRVLKDGSALKKFREMIEAQGGRLEELPDGNCACEESVVARQNGYIQAMDTEKIGKAAMILGAGRQKKEDRIDPLAGLRIEQKIGDRVKAGDAIFRLATNRPESVADAAALLADAVIIGTEEPDRPPLVYETMLRH